MLLIVDSALQKDNPYCREAVICKKVGWKAGEGGTPPGEEKIYHRLVLHPMSNMPFITDPVTSINFHRNRYS
jgi:hypothetical protein